MKKLLFISAVVSVLFTSCGSDKVKTGEGDGADSIQAQAMTVQPNDRMVQFYENGQMKYMQQFLNGIKHGEYKDWYKNGQIRTLGFYEMGMRSGLWKWYDEKGEVNLEIKYDKNMASL
jgi:antitoxin component YwqK of YwqJK toxin-antitoxin module